MRRAARAAAALAALLIFTCERAEASAPAGSCEREIRIAAAKYGIPEGILYSVGLTETGRKGSLQPFALNVEGKALFADNMGEAMQLFQKAKQGGAKLIDVGCMQINHYFHGEAFQSVEDMFEPQDRKSVV